MEKLHLYIKNRQEELSLYVVSNLTLSHLNDVFLHKAHWSFHFLVSQAKFIVIQ